MKARILTLGLAALATLTGLAASAAKGSCITKAKSLSAMQAVTLVDEYDPDEKEFYGSGVMYYTVTLKRGQAYTIWITGGQASSMSLDVDTNWKYYEDKEIEPGAGFDVDSLDGGATQVAYLYAEDWTLPEAGDEKDDYDPKEGKYVVTITGDIGAQTTLGFTTGIKSFTVVGSEESPRVVSMGNSWKSYSGKMIEGAYYFKATLKAGRKYRVYTKGGSATAGEITLDVDSGVGDGDDDPETDETLTPDAAYSNAYNQAWVVVPDVTAKYAFTLAGDDKQAFSFYYTAVPTRGIAAHATIPLLEENGYAAQFVPGRIANTHSYYDEIIDEHLCKIYLPKGARWTFETEGATWPQRMVAYGPSGSVLSVNESLGNGAYDTRVTISASAAGVYYVGVCDPTLDVGDSPAEAASAVILKGRDTSGLPPADAWDSADDVYGGASMLVPYPASTNDVVASIMTNDAAVALGAAHGPHAMNANDYYDCFALACRKGYTYKLRGRFADESDQTDLTLSAKVFTLRGKSEVNVATTGTLTPITADTDALGDLTFKATTNAVHYVRVWVTEGKGLDFPGYSLYALAGVGTNALGVVQVQARGAAGTWSLNSEKMAYPAGMALTVSKSDALTIRANAVSGFTANPASQVVAVPAWTDGASVVTVTNTYFDKYDAKYVMSTKKTTNAKTGKVTTVNVYSPADGDATPAGAFAITPAAKEAALKRTLWHDDPADHFAFTAVSNVFYNFSVANTVAGGDATLVVSNATGVVATGTEIAKLRLPAGRTYLVVAHGTEARADSAYTLTYSRAAAGVVSFTAASFTVKEGAEYAALTLARTGTEGAVRVRYATQAGTALPGTNYYPVTDGVVSWPAGNKATKTIKIRMVPDLQAHWAASNLTFSVRLYPEDEYALAAGEYPAALGRDQAKVTIKEATAKKPGTISLTAYGDGAEEAAVANVKAPSVKGIAGNTVQLAFARTGGADGKVAVKVASRVLKTDTAKAGTDYKAFAKTLTWEDGDAEPKTVEVTLPSVKGYTASKKFTFTMAVVKTGTTPALAAKTGTFTISNATVAQTAAAYAKTIAASTGLALTTKGTWFNDRDGTLRSANAAGSLTYTLTGPGFFACEPKVVTGGGEGDAARLVCKFGTETIDCSAEDFAGRIVRVIGSGKTVVTFTLSGVQGNAYAAFTPQTDGRPYRWTPFSQTKPADPMNKAVVLTNQTTLAWTLPAVLAAENGLVTRVRFGTTSKPTVAEGSLVYVVEEGNNVYGAAMPQDLVAGKTYYWGIDYGYAEAGEPPDRWVSGATWSFSALKDGAPITTVRSGVDTAGNEIADCVADGRPVELIQGVKAALQLAGEADDAAAKPLDANLYRLLAGTLPPGVTIASTGKLSGCPTKVGDYPVLLQGYNRTGTTVTKTVNGVKKKVTTYTYTYGSTVPVTFRVLPAGTSVGSFRAVVAEDGGTFTVDARRQGFITYSSTAAGKLTAKLTLAGNAYTFTATGYDEVEWRDDEADGVQRYFRVRLANSTTVNKKAYKNYLTLLVADGPTTNAVALAERAGAVEELQLNVPNAKKTAVTADVVYTGDLYRYNGGTAEGAAANAPFAGYYTVALVPEGTATAADGVPVGNGYLTFTATKTGSFKVSGMLADGTAVSCSTIGQVQENGFFYVPFYAGTATYSVGGVLELACEAEGATAVLRSSAGLLWTKNAAATTSRDGSGFALTLQPVGGWYDKVVNLQAYYLNEGFAIEAGTGEDLPADALASGYAFTTRSTPQDLGVKFTGNTLVPDAYKAVKNATTGLTDFGASVNPWNVALKFTRATGLVSGTFNAWEWVLKNDLVNTFETKQKTITKLTHRGVLFFTRAEGDPALADNVLTAGFFLMPNTTNSKLVSKTWKASLPFNVISTGEGDGNYEERDFGDVGE